MVECARDNIASRGRVRENQEVPGDKVGSGCKKAAGPVPERAGENKRADARSVQAST